MSKSYFNIQNKNGKARINIIGNISDWNNSSEEFHFALKKIQEQSLPNVEIYINSFGGSVFQANEISNIILGFDGVVNFKLGAVCASAATLIVSQVITQKDDVVIEQYSNGQFMIHNVTAAVAGEIKDFKAAINLMQNLQDNAIDNYVKQTELSKAVIVNMMDKETWFTAKQALEKGFITGIIDKTDKQPDNFADIKNCGYTNLPKILNQSNNNQTSGHAHLQNSKKMDKEIYNKFGLEPTASDLEVLNKIDELQKAKAEAEQKIAELEAEKKETEISSFLDNAVKERKILASEKDGYSKLMRLDMQETKGIINSKEVLPKISDRVILNPKGSKNKSWDDYTGDEKNEMQKNNPELFKQIYENKFNVVPIL